MLETRDWIKQNDRVVLMKVKGWPEEDHHKLDWLGTSMFTPPNNNVLFFFKKCNLNYFKYFKKNKSVFRESNSRFKTLARSLTFKGRTEFQKKNLFYLLTKYLYGRSLNRVNHRYYLGDFLNLFFSTEVVFKYSFHRLDKKIRKFSRGKSKKYKVVYNYIPFF